MVKNLIVLIGEDNYSKKMFVEKLKREVLSSSAKELNINTYFPEDLTKEKLLEVLNIACFFGKRIIIIHRAQNLSDELKKVIEKSLKTLRKDIFLILDFEESERAILEEDNFYLQVAKKAKVYKMGLRKRFNLTSFSKTFKDSDLERSLYIANFLCNQTSSSSQFQKEIWKILGTIIRSYQKLRKKDRKTLFEIFETERRLKNLNFDNPLKLIEFLIIKLLR